MVIRLSAIALFLLFTSPVVLADDAKNWADQENSRVQRENEDHNLSQQIEKIEGDRQGQRTFPESNIYTDQKIDQDLEDLRSKQQQIQREHEVDNITPTQF